MWKWRLKEEKVVMATEMVGVMVGVEEGGEVEGVEVEGAAVTEVGVEGVEDHLIGIGVIVRGRPVTEIEAERTGTEETEADLHFLMIHMRRFTFSTEECFILL